MQDEGQAIVFRIHQDALQLGQYIHHARPCPRGENQAQAQGQACIHSQAFTAAKQRHGHAQRGPSQHAQTVCREGKGSQIAQYHQFLHGCILPFVSYCIRLEKSAAQRRRNPRLSGDTNGAGMMPRLFCVSFLLKSCVLYSGQAEMK